MALSRYAIDKEKKLLLEKQKEEQQRISNTGAAAGIGAGAGAAAGAGTAAGIAAIINAIPGIGQVAYAGAIGIGAIVGAISGSLVGAATAPGSLSDIFSGGDTELKSINQRLEVLARAGEMSDRLRQVGDKTYMKISGIRPTRSDRSVRENRNIRDTRLTRNERGTRLERDTRTERWVQINQTAEQQQTVASLSAFADYNSPKQINDPLDALSRAITSPYSEDSIIGDWGNANFLKYLTGAWLIDFMPSTVDALYWDLDGEGNSLFQNIIYRPIEQAVKGEINIGTMFGALAINMLGSFGQTLDVLANPVKGFLAEGLTGMGKATGFTTGGERTNYDFNTGNIVSDIILEIAWDPMNWITLGGKAIAGVGAKATQTAIKEVGEVAVKEASQEILEKISKTVSKKGTALTADTVTEAAKKYATKNLGQFVSKEVGQGFQITIDAARKEIIEESGVLIAATANKKVINAAFKEATKDLTEEAITNLLNSRTSKLLADQLTKQTSTRVLTDLSIKQGFDITKQTRKAIESYVNDFVKNMVTNDMTVQIQKTVSSGYSKVARSMLNVDRVFTRVAAAGTTFGLSEVFNYTLRKTGAVKILKKIPGKVKAGIASTAVGTVAGAIIGGQIDGASGAGWGALTGGLVGLSAASALLVASNGAVMRSITRGIPKNSDLYKIIKKGKIPFNEYAAFTKQYEDLFNMYSRTMDDTVLKDRAIKNKVNWFTKNTVEGLNPLQTHTLRQISTDTNALNSLMKSNKNAGQIKSAWAEYIMTEHGMTVSKYNQAIRKIGVIEQGKFVEPISKQEIRRLELEYLFISEQIANPKKVTKVTHEMLEAEQIKLINKTFEVQKELSDGKIVSASTFNRRIKINSDLTYHKIVRSDIAMLDKFVFTFSQMRELPEVLTEFVSNVKNKHNMFTVLHGQVQDITQLQSIMSIIRKSELFKKAGYDDADLSNALIKSFWDLRNAPYGASVDELTEIWQRSLNVYGHTARKEGTKGLSSFPEFQDEMRKIIGYVHKDGFLTKSMRSFENINSKDSFIYKTTRTIENNKRKLKTIEKKLQNIPVDNLDLPNSIKELINQRQIMEEQNAILLEWRVKLSEAQATRYTGTVTELPSFTMTARAFEELNSTSSFSHLSDLQKSLGTEYQIQSQADNTILNKFFNFPENIEIDSGLFDNLYRLTQNAKIVNDTISNLDPLYKGTSVRKELDAMWDLIVQSIEDSKHPFLTTIRKDLSVKEKYALLYAISQAIDYRLNSPTLVAIFQPFFDAVSAKKIPHLEALLKSPDSLGFGNFRPGLQNQVQRTINETDFLGITSYNIRKQIIEAQAKKTLGSMTATDLRIQKSKTISNKEVRESLLDVSGTIQTTIGRVKAMANVLGERMDFHMSKPNAGNADSVLAKMREVPPNLRETPNAVSYFTETDIDILEEFWKKGIVPPDDVMFDIAKKAEAYESARWNAEIIMDRYITNAKMKPRVEALLSSKSELQSLNRIADGAPYAGRYVSDMTGSFLQDKARNKIKELVLRSGIESGEELNKLLYSKTYNSLIKFKELIIESENNIHPDIFKEILQLIEDRTDKFTNADALRYLVTKTSNLDAAEFTEYIRIMKELDEQFYMSEIPLEFIPNSYKTVWIQNRLSQWNAQAIINADGYAQAAVEINGYKNLLDGMQSLGKSAYEKQALSYLKKFAEIPGNMLSRMQRSADAAMFRSILETLPTDEAFWDAAHGWEKYINKYYGAQYQAVYLANYAEMLNRGQITVNNVFNMNNSAVRKATMLDMMSGGFEPKLESSIYKEMLRSAGVKNIPDFDVPVQMHISIISEPKVLSKKQRDILKPITESIEKAQKNLDIANAALQQHPKVLKNQRAVEQLEKEIQEYLIELGKQKLPVNIQLEPRMPGTHTAYYSKLHEMQSGIISSLDLQNNPVIYSIMHDGPSINIKSPTQTADKFYNDVIKAFDSQSSADIATRFNMMPDEFISDLANQGGGVLLSYDQIRNNPGTQNYFDLNNKRPGKLLKNIDHKSFSVIYNDDQETAMLILNLKNINYNADTGTVSVYRPLLNQPKDKAIWHDTAERVIQRNYDKLRNVDKKLWKHTVAVSAVDNNKAYGQLWQHNTWGNNNELLDDDFFDKLFNGFQEDDIAKMVGAQTAIGHDAVNYWRGFTNDQLKLFEEMGWGTIENGRFVLGQQYFTSFGQFGMNSMLMGDNAFIRKFYPKQSDNLIESFSKQANHLAAQGKTQLEWIDELYSNSLTLRTMELNGISRKDIFDEIQLRYRETFIGMVISDPRTKSGLRIKELHINSMNDLDFAIKQGALVILKSDAYRYSKYLNNPIKHDKIWNFISKLMYLYKYGWLSLNPGTLMRNWLDTELKTKIELESNSAFYKHYASIILNEMKKANAQIMAISNSKMFFTKSDITKFFNRPDLAQLGIKNLNATMYYQIYDLMRNGPMGNMVQEQYQKTMLRSAKAKYTATDTIKESDKWEEVIGTLQNVNPLVFFNNKIENRNRIALFLHSLDNEMSEGGRKIAAVNKLGISTSAMAREMAYSKISRVHFDYDNRAPIMKKIELIFPFLGWTLDNMSYWLDIIEKKPWIIRMFFNMYQPVWNFDDYSPEQLEQSMALQQMITGGGVPLLGPGGLLEDNDDKRTYMLKLSPSFADAFGGISNPIGALYNRKNSVVTKATELLANGNFSFEDWLADDIGRDPDAYFDAGKKSPEIFKLIQKYADLIPIAGTIYSKWYSAYKQSTGNRVPISTAGMITGGLGTTSHVQLKATAYKGFPKSFKWDPNRPSRVNYNKYRTSLIGLRIPSSIPYTTSRVLNGIKNLPNQNTQKIWMKQSITPRTAVTGMDKITARKLSAKMYGIKISAFR